MGSPEVSGSWLVTCLSQSKNQVSSWPHPAECPIQGKGAGQQEPREGALQEFKEENAAVFGDEDPTGQMWQGLAIFCATLPCATREVSGPEAPVTSAGLPGHGPRTNCGAGPLLPTAIGPTR